MVISIPPDAFFDSIITKITNMKAKLQIKDEMHAVAQ